MHLQNNLKSLITSFIILFSVVCSAQQPYKRKLKLMGSRFDVTVVAKDSIEGNKYIDTAVAEITRIENSSLLGMQIPKLQTLIEMQEKNL